MKNNIPETDQWKLDGDCSKCRRQEFCKKTCSARNKRHSRILGEALSAYCRKTMPSTLADNMEKWL